MACGWAWWVCYAGNPKWKLTRKITSGLCPSSLIRLKRYGRQCARGLADGITEHHDLRLVVVAGIAGKLVI
jgi:hypothetical protein